MSEAVSTVGLIFDFDDTLVPDSTTLLLDSHGIDTKKFWEEQARALVQAGYDPALAYLRLLLDNVSTGKPLAGLTNDKLRRFGQTLDKKFYPGLPGLFKELRKTVSSHKNIHIEYYIVSGGLKAIIDGSQVVQQYFSGAYGCQLAGDTPTGPLKYIKRCVTFTEKTRFLFEINKGLNQAETEVNPYLVNKDVPQARRRIPFKNMIYVGDGLTDIPCFSLVKQLGGTPIGVFDPRRELAAKRAFLEFLKTDRVISIHAPKYRQRDELGSILRAAVATRCAQIEIERQQAESSP